MFRWTESSARQFWVSPELPRTEFFTELRPEVLSRSVITGIRQPRNKCSALSVSGRVLDGHGQPIEGARMEMFHAADNGKCSGLYDDGVPKYNLRAHQFTGADGRYAFTTITPSAYAEPHLAAVEGIAEVCAALGRSLYRPARIHFEVHHPDLIAPWAGEIYFKGDPVIPVDFVGAKKAPLSLQADSVLHENPQDVAGAGFQNPYRTLEFDSVLKAHTPAPTPSARRGRRHEPRGRDRLVAVPAQHRLLPPRRPPRTRRSAGTLRL
ncbi:MULTISPECIES: hypothetical protein [unclassified Streptomyces]|uniref:dioxygenase family protein n=1 Tax=unclassified Streptomyces TaxID=2593676 RepID=UPI0036E81DD7